MAWSWRRDVLHSSCARRLHLWLVPTRRAAWHQRGAPCWQCAALLYSKIGQRLTHGLVALTLNLHPPRCPSISSGRRGGARCKKGGREVALRKGGTIEGHAMPHHKKKIGQTASASLLHVAATYGHLELVRKLLKRSASVDLQMLYMQGPRPHRAHLRPDRPANRRGRGGMAVAVCGSWQRLDMSYSILLKYHSTQCTRYRKSSRLKRCGACSVCVRKC